MNEASAHVEDSTVASQRADTRRSDQLDKGAVGTVSRVGDVPEELRGKQKQPRRSEESYINDHAARMLKFIECFQGREFEPVTIARLMQRSGFNRDATMRLVTTAKKCGWAKELPSKKERVFVAGPKLENLARSLSAAMLTRP